MTDALPVLERYDCTSSCTSVNDARGDLFMRKGRDIDLIPPTADALCQHAKRAVFQVGHCWGKSLEVSLELPFLSEWGWVRGPSQAWEPLWTIIPRASENCQGLLKCGYKSEKGGVGRCKCIRTELPCTAHCHCGRLCGRS